MKDLLNAAKFGIGYGLAAGIALKFGYWLWDEVLEDKFDDLKERLTKTE